MFLAFLAKIMGTFKASAVKTAGAIPDASMVTTLVIPAEANFSAKPYRFLASIDSQLGGLKRNSTLRMLSPKDMPILEDALF